MSEIARDYRYHSDAELLDLLAIYAALHRRAQLGILAPNPVVRRHLYRLLRAAHERGLAVAELAA